MDPIVSHVYIYYGLFGTREGVHAKHKSATRTTAGLKLRNEKDIKVLSEVPSKELYDSTTRI